MNTSVKTVPNRMGAVQIGIIGLTIATALIHLILAFASPGPTFTPLFILNAVGYLVLLGGLFLNIPFARDHRGLFRWALVGLAAVTIAGWLVIGDKSWPSGALGYITKLIEVGLIILLFVDNGQRG